MGAQGRVQRSLPSEAIKISAIHMDDPTFRTPFAEMLIKLDAFTPEDAYRMAKKAGTKLGEIRNAIDPRYFTEMVFGILRGMGKPMDILRIHKHVRDDVIWSNALTPWRRSPLWMVLRVAIQATFENQCRYVRITFLKPMRSFWQRSNIRCSVFSPLFSKPYTDTYSVLRRKLDAESSKLSWLILWLVSWISQLRSK
jgi:hypothetical protein